MPGRAAGVGGDDRRTARSAAGRLAARTVSRLWRDLVAGLSLVGRAAWSGVVGFYNSDNLTHAASIAYFGLLSLFPLFLLFFSLVGTMTAAETHRDAAVRFFLNYFPAQFDFLVGQLDSLRQTRFRLGVGGALALVWAAHGVFGAVSSAVNHAWGVEKPRSYLKSKLFALLMLVAAGAGLLVALLLVSGIQIAQAGWFAGVAARWPVLGLLTGISARWTATALLVTVVGLVFYFVPNTTVRFRDVWIGALLTGLLWRGALAAFSWYARDMARYTWIHGSIAAVVVFLIWIYTSAFILLYGAEFTAAYAHIRRERRKRPAPPA